jgi:hypothetical protein
MDDQSSINLLTREINRLEKQVQDLLDDIDTISDSILNEPATRSQYYVTDESFFTDRFIEEVNSHLQVSQLRQRPKRYTATYTIEVLFDTTADKGHVAEQIGEAIYSNGDNLGGYLYEITGKTVESVVEQE